MHPTQIAAQLAHFTGSATFTRHGLVPGIAESRHRLGQQSRWKPDLIDGTGRDSRFTDVGY